MSLFFNMLSRLAIAFLPRRVVRVGLSFKVQGDHGVGKLNFSRSVATVEFSKCAGLLSEALSQHHLSGFEIAQLEFHHLH